MHFMVAANLRGPGERKNEGENLIRLDFDISFMSNEAKKPLKVIAVKTANNETTIL